MRIILRGRAPLATRTSLLLVALTMSLFTYALTSCAHQDTPPPPATVIRADETPALEGTTPTPTPTPTPGAEGYPGPVPTTPVESGYPSSVGTPPPPAAPSSAYPSQ